MPWPESSAAHSNFSTYVAASAAVSVKLCWNVKKVQSPMPPLVPDGTLEIQSVRPAAVTCTAAVEPAGRNDENCPSPVPPRTLFATVQADGSVVEAKPAAKPLDAAVARPRASAL